MSRLAQETYPNLNLPSPLGPFATACESYEGLWPYWAKVTASVLPQTPVKLPSPYRRKERVERIRVA